MSLTPPQYQKIIHFLDADMTLDEMDAFEQELAVNPEMQQQLDFEQSVRDSFAFYELSKSSEVIVEKNIQPSQFIGGEAHRSVRTITAKGWLTISIAASVLIVIIVYSLLRFQTPITPRIAQKKDTTHISKHNNAEVIAAKPNSNDDSIRLAILFKQYFKKDKIPEAYPMLLAEALTGYESGNYSAIAKLNLSNISETRGIDDTINTKENIIQLGHYYKGIAYLQTGNAAQVIRNLQWVVKNADNKELIVKAKWYLALVYLRNNSSDKAKELLEKVAGNKQNRQLSTHAKIVLDKMKK